MPPQVVQLDAFAAGGVRLQLAGTAAGAAFATLAFSRFVPTACDEGLASAAAAAAPVPSRLHQTLPQACSTYSSGKRLAEETRYCLERRRLELQAGCSYPQTVQSLVKP